MHNLKELTVIVDKKNFHDMKTDLHVTHDRQVISAALTLLDWAIHATKQGKTIALLNEDNSICRKLDYDALHKVLKHDTAGKNSD